MDHFVVRSSASGIHIRRSRGNRVAKIFIPSTGPHDWRSLLAEPNRHWQNGFSAQALAHSWEAAKGLPSEIASLFDQPVELLLALPEHKVPLPGGNRESQSDVFALVRSNGKTVAMTVEGKVDEPFGPTVGEWLEAASPGKRTRLAYLCELLGLQDRPVDDIRYQLLHRSASAIIEAARFKTDEAAMLVHSFSKDRRWFEDFVEFASRLGANIQPDRPSVLTLATGRVLRIGWASGDPRYLRNDATSP
jgi:hypothetical protein